MYAPHTVTVFNISENQETLTPETCITILRGVLLDISQGSNIMKSGIADADAAVLYIPLGITAVNALTGQTQRYLPPKEYDAEQDKSGIWTIGERGDSSSVGCFFVEGEIIDPKSTYGQINAKYDYCYRVTRVDVRNFGSRNMQHLQVWGA